MIGFRSLAFGFLLLPLLARAADPEFVGHVPHPLDAAKIEALKQFVAASMEKLGVPGVGFAVIDHGKVLFEGGLGVRALGRPDKVGAHTKFMIGSNTKGLTTLLLARLVDRGKLSWDQPAAAIYPAFRLGDGETVRKVRIRDLVCACTGLPRKDMIWIIGTQPDTGPGAVFAQLASSTPTTAFGAVFQYSNLMAAAGGYIGGVAAYPRKDLGEAYDAAMKAMIFDPLGMADTTFAMARAEMGDFAMPHGLDLQGAPLLADLKADDVIVPYRPAGGAWSSAHDMIRYVALELSQGVLPGGKRLVSAANLLTRRQPTVKLGENISYGMGLVTDNSSGASLIRHGGGISGYRSDIAILPDADVGAVILTNGGGGTYLPRPFMRRLMELVYDGEDKASGDIDAAVKNLHDLQAATRDGLSFPAAPDLAARVVGTYGNDELGRLTARRDGDRLYFDYALYSTEMGSRIAADGRVSFYDPVVAGLTFTLSDQSLVLKEFDGSYEYRFVKSTGR